LHLAVKLFPRLGAEILVQCYDVQGSHDLLGRRVFGGFRHGFLVLVDGQVISIVGDFTLWREETPFRALAGDLCVKAPIARTACVVKVYFGVRRETPAKPTFKPCGIFRSIGCRIFGLKIL
jgi:hypothetical protein